jgi:hypothetical protein
MPTLKRRVQENYEEMGYAMPRKPVKAIPDLPWDLGDLSEGRLMQLYTQFTQWANYLNVQVAKAEAEEEDNEANVRTTEALFMARQSDAGVKLNDARALRDGDEDIQTARKELAVAKHTRKLTAVLLGNCERSAAACSRELTRRTTLAPHERRSST